MRIVTRRQGFTLIELMVAVGLLATVIAISGIIFRVSVKTYHLAQANEEVLEKFNMITSQLDADLQGLRKEGLIFIGWALSDDPNIRSDRMLFFSNQPVSTFNTESSSRIIEGHVARIVYCMSPSRPDGQPYATLIRSQHVLTSDPELPVPETLNGKDWTLPETWLNNLLDPNQYDLMTLQDWRNLPFLDKWAMLRGMLNFEINDEDTLLYSASFDPVDARDPNDRIHLRLCDGIGEFRIEGWARDPSGTERWIPENRDLIEPTRHVGGFSRAGFVLYPHVGDPSIASDSQAGEVRLGGDFPEAGYDERFEMNPDSFYHIPGLGRALRFTFTLYDARGVLPNGRTFTHIVYLDR